jgi:hypothetical protein
MINVTLRFNESDEKEHPSSIQVLINSDGDIAFAIYSFYGELESAIGLNLDTAVALSKHLDSLIDKLIEQS